MRNAFLYSTVFVAMVCITSCNEDFNKDIAAPQAWEQEEKAGISTLSISATNNINLEDISDEKVKLFDYSVNNKGENDSVSNMVVFLSKHEVEEWKRVDIDENCCIKTDDLQKIIENFYGKQQEIRSIFLKAEANLTVNGEVLFLSSDKVSIEVTPRKPLIVPEYYIVGNIQGWNDKSKTCALYPLDLENNTFTYTTDFSNGGGTPNFKIWSAADFGSWDKAIGIEQDGDTSLEGSLIQGNVGAIQTPDNSIYTVTLDLIGMKYKMVKEENQTPTTYKSIGLIGNFNNWGDDLDMIIASPHNWYLNGLTIESDGEIKFRANDEWNYDWGGNLNIGDTPFGKSELKGGNLKISAGTYDVFFNDITGQFAFFARN